MDYDAIVRVEDALDRAVKNGQRDGERGYRQEKKEYLLDSPLTISEEVDWGDVVYAVYSTMYEQWGGHPKADA